MIGIRVMGGTSEIVRIYVDGGARGNPGPAAAGILIESTQDGSILYEAGLFLGKATNNVAEYRGLIAGLRQAHKIGADRVEIFSDSELLVKQFNGEYRVRNPVLQNLYNEAKEWERKFRKCTVNHIRREQNAPADRLVNRAIDARADILLPRSRS